MNASDNFVRSPSTTPVGSRRLSLSSRAFPRGYCSHLKGRASVTFECSWETCLDCARRAAARRLDDVTLPDQDPLASPQYLQRSVQHQKAARSALIAYLLREKRVANYWQSGLHLRAL